MDAKQLGLFIAGRRKELGMTQAALAQQLHVTDKAVSRWERGIGLPDINSIEVLAKALDVSLVELMQAKRNVNESISAQDAEQLVSDAIKLPRSSKTGLRIVGSTILGCFGVVSVWLMLFVSSYGSGFLSAGSIIAGLISWGIPIGCLFFERRNTGITASASFGFAIIALVVQVMGIAGSAGKGDWQSIEDTIRVLAFVCAAFSLITLFLNTAASVFPFKKDK